MRYATVWGIIAIVLLWSFSGCVNPVEPQTFSISGHVRLADGTGVAGVAVSFGSGSVTTDSTGAYAIDGLSPGTYTLSLSHADYAFEPAQTSIQIASADRVGVDFTASLHTYSISGHVRLADGTGVSEVTVSSGDKSGATDAAGAYTLTGLTRGTHAVSAAHLDYVFEPAETSVEIVNAGQADVDFTASLRTYSISGHVRQADGTGVSGVTVSLGDGPVTTDEAGAYRFDGLANGTYAVAPSNAAFLFDPATRSVTINRADQSNVDFTATPRNLMIVLDSSLEVNVTTAEANLPVSGRVLVLDNGPLPAALDWSSQHGTDILNGSLPVDADGRWAGTVPLVAGDNTVVFSVLGATNVSLQATYNAGYTFGGQLLLSPDVAYVSEARQITASIALTDAQTDATRVSLVRVNDTETKVADLTDDGDLSHGDEIEGDQIYTGRFDIEESAETVARFRVVVGLSGGSAEVRSELFPLRVTTHLSDEALQVLLDKQAGYQTQLDEAAANGTTAQVVDAILAELQNDPTVAQAGKTASGTGVWVIYQDGIAGALYSPAAGDKRGPGGPSPRQPAVEPPASSATPPASYQHFYKPNTLLGGPSPAAPPHLLLQAATKNLVKSNKALVIAAQYFDWGEGDDIPVMAKKLQDDSCFKVTYIKYTAQGAGSVEDFKGLGSYGVILVSSHGDSFYNGILSFWQDRFGWNGPWGQVILHSNMRVTTANKVTYEDDLKAGRLVIWYGNYGITPTFVRRYAGSLPNSMVYFSICRGAWNGTMANAFLAQGAATYLGYSDYVAVAFTQAIGPPLLNTLLTPGKTMKDAFIPGQKETDKDPAEFRLFGDDDLSLEISGLQDGGFESNSITQAWSVDGDARIIPALGSYGPTEGSYMAVISTGLGFTTATGTLTQQICLGDESQISFDWNFFSEEFMEWVGSIYQDTFSVSISEVDNPANSVTLLNATVDGLAGEVFKVANSFDRGDVYATGWRTFTNPIPAGLQNKRVELKFYATDVGDSIYDTAVLIDRIEITKP